MSEQDFYSQYLKPEEPLEPAAPDTPAAPAEPTGAEDRPHNGVEPSDAHTDPRMPVVDPHAVAPPPAAPAWPTVGYPPAAPPDPAAAPPGRGRHALGGAPGESGVVPAPPAGPPAGYQHPGRHQPPPPAGAPQPPPGWAPRPPEPPAWPARGGESVGPMQAQVRQADLVRPYKPTPESGWRKKLYKTTKINLGPGASEREWNDLRRRLKVNLRGTYVIAVLQQKGGVSKTTAALGIGAALAHYRSDKVVAIDANPASGNLSKRINEPSTGTWRTLLADPNLHSYSDFRHHLGMDSSSGLEVLAGDPGDAVLTGRELVMAWQRLARVYPVALLDCGNQMRDDITAAVLSMADAVVVVSTTRYDGAEAAQQTLNWLISHGYPGLVREAVMVISNVNKITPTKAVRNLHEGFERVVRAVHDIPYDPHLSDATAVDFNRLAPATRRAFIEAAASVADGFVKAADKDPGYRPQWPEQGEGWR
ncbi:MinD/ParA family ATP-binding protein [Mycolicibacterium vinylchloridicum]|uniref:MinD/ParA family ATP-binding protein n=1 Tax=Mycolicibacterium vinylchloridicum TaxID=2736928 RepID=UPI002D7FD4E6|nr:MinD/ParA family protein [Mycolicibacterium vinylchloridicum]